MRINETLKKVGGLIFEFDEPTPEDQFYQQMSSAKKEIAEASAGPAKTTQKTAEQVALETPGPALSEVKVPAATSVQVVGADGSVDFKAIYQLGHLPAAAITAEQILDLLATLPVELPLETKRATVKVTLQSMGQSLGATPETVVADASRKLAALASYSQSYSGQANDYVMKSEAEIANLENEIARRRQAIEQAKSKQAQVSAACEKESDRLDDILEFLSLDVAPSKLA